MSTSFAKPINNISTTVGSTYTAGSGILTVANAAGITLSAGQWCRISTFDGSGAPKSILKATAVSGNVLVIASAIEGTTDVNLQAGYPVEMRVTAGAFEDIHAAVNALESSSVSLPIAESDVTNLTTDLSSKAPLDSPALTGTPTAPTPSTADNTTKVATTAYVQAQGYVTASTAPVTSVAGRTGAVTLSESDVANLTTDLAAKAPLASPALTGTPTAPTPTGTDNSTKLATTAFVKGQSYLTSPIAESDVTGLATDLAAKAPLASPTFTGTPAAPTPSTADNTTKIATTAYVQAQGYVTSSTAPVTSVAGKTGAVTLAGGDITSGTVSVSNLPVMVASGASHAAGLAPDPGSSSGTTKFLREDASWAVPAGGGGTPGGSDTQVQYNSSGSFAGSADLTWSDSTKTLTVSQRASGSGSVQVVKGCLSIYTDPDKPGYPSDPPYSWAVYDKAGDPDPTAFCRQDGFLSGIYVATSDNSTVALANTDGIFLIDSASLHWSSTHWWGTVVATFGIWSGTLNSSLILRSDQGLAPPILSDSAAFNNTLFLGSDHLDGASQPKLCRKAGGVVTVIG